MTTIRWALGQESGGAALRARDWLDHELFASAPSGRPLCRSRVLGGMAAAVLLTVVQVLRMSSSDPLNSIWAEDGARWLTVALIRGFWPSLRMPYDGYLETSSRLIAEPISRLPVSWYAVAMALAGAIVVTGCAFVVWTASAAHVRSVPLRLALAALVVLAPTAGVEMLDNVTNTIWYLLFISFWLLLWRPPTMPRALAGAALLTLAALSTAGVVFMVPLWLLRVIAIRSRRDLPIVVALPVGLGFQISPLLHGGYGQMADRWNWDLLPAYAQRVVAGAVLGDRLAGTIWEHVGVSLDVAAGLGLMAFVAYAALRARPGALGLVLLAVFTSLLCFFASGFERALGPQLLWRAGTDSTVVTRYCMVPALLLFSAVLVLIDDLQDQRDGGGWPLALAWLVIVAATSFSIGDPAIRGTPRYSVAVRSARTGCPAGATVTSVPVSPSFFTPMRVPCRRLR